LETATLLVNKYLSLLIPLTLCGGLSLYFAVAPPRVDRDGYGYDHAYLSQNWGIAAVVSTLLLDGCLGIHDLSTFLQRRWRRRAIRRQFGDEL
jgi:hypothetical protein